MQKKYSMRADKKIFIDKYNFNLILNPFGFYNLTVIYEQNNDNITNLFI